MKIKIALLFFFFGLTITYAQEPLNQRDGKGKKDGKWIVLLNKNWREVKDSSQAVYYRYNYYDHGEDIYPMGPCGRKGWTLESSTSGGQNEKIKLLDGEYKWIDRKGRVNAIHVLKAGEYVSYKQFLSSGKADEYFDYTKKYKEEPHTYCMYIYTKKHGTKYYYVRKGVNGWLGYPCSADDL